MSGSVRKYGSTWRIRYDAGLKPDGKRDQRSRGGFSSRRDADKALAEAMDRVRRGDVLSADRITVGEWLDTWLASKRNIRPTTARAYGGHIRVYLKPLIGGIPLASLRADHLDRMYAAISGGELRHAPSIATVRRIHATLRTALQSAYKRRLISFNPAGQVDLAAEVTHARAVWTPTELATFLSAAENHRLGPAFRLAAFTGLRRGELCGLRWSDVDLDVRTATIRQQLVESGRELLFGEPKTKKGARVISVDADTVAVLRSHKAAQAAERLAWGPLYLDADLVFCRENGLPLRPSLVSQQFMAVGRAAGLPRIVFHGLRHTHATHALAAGVAIKVVSDRLGHATSAFTADTYTRVLPEVDQEAADLVARLVKNAGAQRAVSGAP